MCCARFSHHPSIDGEWTQGDCGINRRQRTTSREAFARCDKLPHLYSHARPYILF